MIFLKKPILEFVVTAKKDFRIWIITKKDF